MNDSDTDNSQMFKVDHSDQHECQSNDKKQNYFFDKDKVILNEGQKRIVVYGTLQQQPRTIYQIVQPYMLKAAQVTGQVANYAGKQIYKAITTGANWIYDKVVNTVIPYTAQEIPKLIFIIKNNIQKNEKIESASFQVLQIDEEDYNQIQRKKRKNNKKTVVIPFDSNENSQFVQFMKKQKIVPDTSFPIDTDISNENQAFLIPSGNFMAVYNQVTNKNMIKNQQKIEKNLQINHHQTEQISINQKITEQKTKEETKQEQNHKPQQQNKNQENGIKSIIESHTQNVYIEDYKKIQNKKVFKLKDCYVFDLQGQNSNEYDLLDGIQKDQTTKRGYFIQSTKLNIGDGNSSDGYSGQAPLLTQKNVDNHRKVRVQLPKQTHIQKVEEKKLQFA